MHILHQYGEWIPAGEILSVPRGTKDIMFDQEDLVKLGEVFETGCMRCEKVKVRLAYDGRRIVDPHPKPN